MMVNEGCNVAVRGAAGLRPEEYMATRMVDLMDRANCLNELTSRLHPYGLSCPKCGSVERIGHGKSKAGYQAYRCRSCGRVYSLLSETPFSGTKLGPCELVLFMRLLAAGHSPAEIGREVGLHRNSVTLLAQKLAIHARVRGAN